MINWRTQQFCKTIEKRKENIRKEQKGLLLHPFVKRISFSPHKLARSMIRKSTSHMHMTKH
jgi:hypothetical protein